MSEESIDLIRLMLDRDVERRVTIGQVLEHAWMRDEGGDAVAEEGKGVVREKGV